MSFKLESRWSKRGIKKCPKCGTFNGHRAAQCKNKQCGQVLKGGGPLLGNSGKIVEKCDQLMAVQLQAELEDQSAKLYSIRRLNGNKEDRGFVEIRDCVDGADEQLELKTGICYVDCEPHTDIDGTCQHVRVAAATEEVAEGLVINKEVLEKIDATDVEKQEIWKQQISSGADDPLVQRVSNDIFVVKCYDDLHQLVPYCHVELKMPSRFDLITFLTVLYSLINYCFSVSPAIAKVWIGIIKKLLQPLFSAALSINRNMKVHSITCSLRQSKLPLKPQR